MVDWAGHAGQSTEYRYRSMASRQLRGTSYERLCLGVADDAEVLALLRVSLLATNDRLGTGPTSLGWLAQPVAGGQG